MTQPTRHGLRCTQIPLGREKRYPTFRLGPAAFATALLWVTGPAHATACTLPLSNPDSVYIVNGDGTVIDTRTNLMWQQCAYHTSGAGCSSGTVLPLSWSNALAAANASTLAGHDDWRLPNIKELVSLVEYCGTSPAINTNVFPNVIFDIGAGPNANYFSSSPYITSFSQDAWHVNFLSGYITSSDFDAGLVRFVRGPQIFDRVFANGFDP